jgi:hypothetical protein
MTKSTCSLATVLLFLAIPLFATAQRTFVSTSGSDTNTCLRDQPCRNFAAALAQTSAGGEVVALDSGGYGPIPLISQSVAIIAPLGVHAAMTVFSGHGIIVNAPGQTVILRNIYMTGLGATNGITVVDASVLEIEHAFITGFTAFGIAFYPASASELRLVDSVLRGTDNIGLAVGSGTVGLRPVAIVTRSRFEDNANQGVAVLSVGHVNIRDSVAAGNGTGFLAQTSVDTDNVRVELEGCTAVHNGTGIKTGVAAGAGTNSIRVSNCSVTGNTVGVSALAGTSQILSRQNNTVEDNGINGAFTTTYASK